MKILTKDSSGKPNGYVLPIWNALENPDLRPEQIYLTAIAPGCRKGPHLHMKRRGLFCCLKGEVRIVARHPDGQYDSHLSVEGHGMLVTVPPGIPAAIYNDGKEEALVLNMPAPSWSAEDPDEWPVEDWVE